MSYSIQEIGRPISLTIGTPSLQIKDITDWSYNDEKQIGYRASGNAKYKRHHIANFDDVLTIKTSDVSLAIGDLEKGTTVSNVVFLAEAPYVGDAEGTTNSIGLQHSEKLKISMSYCVVEESRNISGNAEGAPAEYEIKLRAIRKPDGTDATVEVDLVAE